MKNNYFIEDIDKENMIFSNLINVIKKWFKQKVSLKSLVLNNFNIMRYIHI